jgi:branched-chain amino acid transport system substrate-binding protein
MTAEDQDPFRVAVEDAITRWQSAEGGSRARAEVFSSVTPTPFGRPNPWVSGGTGTNDETPHGRILVQPPQATDVRGRISGFAPVRIGYLVDIDTGSLLGDCLDAVVLAIEDALSAGDTFRPIEVIPKIARGLPREAAAHTVRGYEELVEQGCLVVIGPYITDNGLALLPATERHHVPLISHNGSRVFSSHYGFTIANGGLAEEGAIMAGWLAEKGHLRIGTIVEISPGGQEYAAAFRDAARRNGISIASEVYIEQNGALLKEGLAHLHSSVMPDAIAYCGYGYPVGMFNPILRDLGWDPPRIMSSAFMWYINEPRLLKDLEGWCGIDQTGPIGEDEGTPNPNHMSLLERFDRRFGRRIVHAMIACSYDAGRVAVAGLAKAPLLTPDGVVVGLESLTMYPSSLGGPRTYISFGPHDRKGAKGDWLTIRKMVDGQPRFEGYLTAVRPFPEDRSH